MLLCFDSKIDVVLAILDVSQILLPHLCATLLFQNVVTYCAEFC